jgi:Amino acid permeases
LCKKFEYKREGQNASDVKQAIYTYKEYKQIYFSSTQQSTIMWNAVWNLLPLLQGSSVFSMPYAVVAGGYIVIPFVVLMTMMGDATSIILIDCLYKIDEDQNQKKRVHKDYTALAKKCLGKYGSHIFRGLLIVYLYLGDVSNMVLLSKSAYDILRDQLPLNFTLITIAFGTLVFPTLFIRRLKVIAYISALSVAVVAMAIVALLVILFTQHDQWKDFVTSIPIVELERFPVSTSIVMFSCVSHSVLTKIEGEMKDPSDAPKVVHFSYFVSGILKMAVGTLGALTFGPHTKSIVTLNAGKICRIFEIIFAVANIAFGIFNFPLCMFVISDTVDNAVKNRKVYERRLFRYSWMFVTRLLLTTGTIILALVLPYFGNLLALRGSLIATCLVFVFPCFFHLRLKWKELTIRQKIFDIALILIGLFLGLTGFLSSVYNLVKIIRVGHE